MLWKSSQRTAMLAVRDAKKSVIRLGLMGAITVRPAGQHLTAQHSWHQCMDICCLLQVIANHVEGL